MGKDTGLRICAAALKLLDSSGEAAEVTMRRVAAEVGLAPMAIYKHFPSRDALLKTATLTEYERIGGYFQRANARKNIKRLRGMLGYLDYALDHPNLFRYMFSSAREDAYVFPHARSWVQTEPPALPARIILSDFLAFSLSYRTVEYSCENSTDLKI
jgi:AcrR family transcriptional regulator